MKYIIPIQLACLFVTFNLSSQAIASDQNYLPEHVVSHQAWVLEGEKFLAEVYSRLEFLSDRPGYEDHLITAITYYLNKYNSMKADLLYYRGLLYRILGKYAQACEDFKSAASLAAFQNLSDVDPIIELAKIYSAQGKKDQALYILSRAKKSPACTEKQRIFIDSYLKK